MEKFLMKAKKLKLYIFMGIALIILLIIIKNFSVYLVHPSENTHKYTKTVYALDTQISLTIYGDEQEKANNDILNQAEQEIYRWEKLLSTTDKESDIYAVNHSEGKPVAVNRDTLQAVEFALNMAKLTNRALEPTLYPIIRAWGFTTGKYHVLNDAEIQNLLPLVDYTKVNVDNNNSEITMPNEMQLDLGAVGKGYIGDKIIELLKAKGVTSAVVNLGGNVQTLGHKPDGSLWKVGVKEPDSNNFLGIVDVVDKAVITSGGYERFFTGEDGQIYWHILDATTGKPAHSGIISATVIGKEGKVCDALSTALFVMGKDKAIDYWRQYQDFEMILVTEADNNSNNIGEIYITEGLEHNFQLQAEYQDKNINWIRK